MAIKKKSTSHTQHAQAAAEAEVSAKSSAPVVTQVVEVVDDEGQTSVPESSVPSEEHASAAQPMEEVPATTFTDDLQLPESSSSVDQPKQKEVVEELFAKEDPSFVPLADSPARKKINMKVLWIIAAVAAATLVGVALFAFARKSTTTVSFVSTPTSTVSASPTQEPTSTPAPAESAIKRADVKVQVLNGGGAKGAASKMKKFLEDKGYKVTETGNTEEFNHDKTEVYVKNGKDVLLTLLSDDLKASYTLGTAAATLKSDAAYDARVIVGK